MRIFLTGGAGDLGQYVCRSLAGMGHTPVVFDVRRPEGAVDHSEGEDSRDLGAEAADSSGAQMPWIDTSLAMGSGVAMCGSKASGAGASPSAAADLAGLRMELIQGSITERVQLRAALKDIDVAVHIAAWHGIHEFRGEKTAWDFWDLNFGGTFNVFQSAQEAGIKNLVFISSTSIDDRFGLYGHTKVLGEEMARAYASRHGLNIIVLRPRAFIPPYNRHVYAEFIDWARWFSKGAVHISDVSQAVIKSIELLLNGTHEFQHAPLFLTIDGAYEFSEEDLANWDADGPGSTFRKTYGKLYDVAVASGLDPTLRPTRLDISETQKVLNYRPLYSMKTLLLELKMYGPEGPYASTR